MSSHVNACACACLVGACLKSHTVRSRKFFVSFTDQISYLTVASIINPADTFLILNSNLITFDIVPRHDTAQLDMDMISALVRSFLVRCLR